MYARAIISKALTIEVPNARVQIDFRVNPVTPGVFAPGLEDVAVLQLDILGGIGETAYDLIASAHIDCIWSSSSSNVLGVVVIECE